MLRNELLIYFPSKEFYSGEVFEGYAELRLPFPLKTTGVRMEIIGREVSELNGRRDLNVFLNLQSPLKGPGSDGKSVAGNSSGILGGILGGKPKVEQVQAGVHNYPFTIALPENLPPAYSSPMASIEYEVKVIVAAGEKTMADLVSCARLPVGGSLFDFNFLGNKSTPVQIKEQKTFLMTKGTFDVTLSLDSQVFLSGDTIKARFQLFNSSGKKINDVTVKLMQKIEVFFGGKSVKEDEYVLSQVSLGAVDSKQQKHPTAELPIPTTAPESIFSKQGAAIKVGKNIQITYEIFVQGDVTLAQAFKMNVPIFIVRQARHAQLIQMAQSAGMAGGMAPPTAGSPAQAMVPPAQPYAMAPQQPVAGQVAAGMPQQPQQFAYAMPPQQQQQQQQQQQMMAPARPQMQQQQQMLPQQQYQYQMPPQAAGAPVAQQGMYPSSQPQAVYPSLATDGTQFDYNYQKDIRTLPPPPKKAGQGGAAYDEFYQ